MLKRALLVVLTTLLVVLGLPGVASAVCGIPDSFHGFASYSPSASNGDYMTDQHTGQRFKCVNGRWLPDGGGAFPPTADEAMWFEVDGTYISANDDWYPAEMKRATAASPVDPEGNTTADTAVVFFWVERYVVDPSSGDVYTTQTREVRLHITNAVPGATYYAFGTWSQWDPTRTTGWLVPSEATWLKTPAGNGAYAVATAEGTVDMVVVTDGTTYLRGVTDALRGCSAPVTAP